MVMVAKIPQEMVNARDLAGNMEEEEGYGGGWYSTTGTATLWKGMGLCL